MATKEQIYEKLNGINYPGFDRTITSFGIVKEIILSDKTVQVVLDLRTSDKNIKATIQNDIMKKLEAFPDIDKVVILDQQQKGVQNKKDDEFLPDVKYKIAVASGKGGVGKSTISVNLALALANKKLKVGLLDSDIYGPSIPLMMGIDKRPVLDGQKLLPIDKYGLKIMSLGFLLTDDSPVIWRGPLVMRALQQLMKDVYWGELDVMIFDMPPGTGDAQLTLSQSITLDGAIIVSTPQDVALLDAVKGVQMFKKVNVPILGIVENMSYFICPNCSHKSEIFAAGGVKKECEKLDIPLLGEIPLDPEIRVGGDIGIPIVEKNPENPQAHMFNEIAETIAEILNLNS